MRSTLLLLLLAVLATLTACGTDSASSEPAPSTAEATAAEDASEPAPGGGAWPEAETEAFLDACTAQADAELCGCAADVLQAEIGYEELLAQADNMMSADALPPELLVLVVEACL